MLTGLFDCQSHIFTLEFVELASHNSIFTPGTWAVPSVLR